MIPEFWLVGLVLAMVAAMRMWLALLLIHSVM